MNNKRLTADLNRAVHRLPLVVRQILALRRWLVPERRVFTEQIVEALVRDRAEQLPFLEDEFDGDDPGDLIAAFFATLDRDQTDLTGGAMDALLALLFAQTPKLRAKFAIQVFRFRHGTPQRQECVAP